MADTPVGTAFVEIRPDLTGFTAELQAALRTAVRGLVPPTAGLAKAAGGQAALGAATRGTTKALSEQAVVMQVNSTELARFSRGVAATSLAQFGLRGATLAATSSFLAGAAALTALARAVGIATSFNSQLAVFAATTGATASEMNRVSDASKALGRDLTLPGVSATDAATAMTELAKAGLSVENAISGARGVLELAGAAGIDFAQATELAASAINAFQLAGRDAVKVADVLANAANSAQGSIVDVGIAFQQAAAIGHQVGLSFQDVTLFITELARAGLTGSDAGTSLRTALIRLINPTKKAKEIFKELGLEVRDASGNLRPEFFTNLGIAIANMSAKQRDATLAVIGGQDAIRALSILSRTNIKDLIAQREALDKTGTAAKVNEARMTGLKGAAAGLSNTIEGLALSLGQKATPSLIAATTAVTGFITATAQSPAIGVLGETFHVVADAIRELSSAAGTVAPILQSLIGGLSAVAGAVGPGTILTGVAAYLLLGRTLVPLVASTKAATAAIRLFAAEVATSIALGGGFRAALALMTESMVGFLTSTTGVTLGLTVLAAGLFFLLTRESATERATKALKNATDDLATALRNAADANDTLARSQSALRTDRLEAQAAKLAAAQARADLANSNAAKGSLTRAQLENRLAIALDTVRRAEEQLAQDRKDVAAAGKDANASSQARIAAAQQEADALDKVAAAARGHAQFSITKGLAKSEVEINQAIVQSLDDRIAALAKLPGAENRALAARLNAIRQLVGHTKDFDLTNRLILQSDTLDQGLGRLQSLLERTGQSAGAALVEGMRLKLNPASVGKVLGDLPGVFAALGKKSGDGFNQTLAAAIQNGLDAVNRLILRGSRSLSDALGNQTATLLQNVQRADLLGGSLEEQLAIAKTARARAERELKAADDANRESGGRSQADKKRVADAISGLSSADSDVSRIQGEIAAKVKADADAAKKKLDDAKKARDAADQAFIDLLGNSQALLDLRLAKADLTESLVDNISAQKALSAFFKQEIAAANKSIADVQLRTQTVNQLRQALISSEVATRNMLREQRQAARQRIIDKRDRQEESLELDVQIAETQKNKAKEKQAHQRLLDFLLDRQKHAARGTVEWKRLQLKIEQEKAAIKELNKAQKAKADALKALEFSFLQTQTGFVANLLGNLLPSGSVAGTVGGGVTTGTTTAALPLGKGAVTPTGGGPSGGGGGGVIDSGVAADTQKNTTAGPTHSQLSVLIAIARAQLALFQQGRAGTAVGHPEVAVVKAAANGAMDTLPW